MSKLVVVVGLSGVGKSTVIEEAMKLSSSDYEWLNYGDEMLEISKSEGLAESRDEMKNIDPNEYKKIQRKAAERIQERSEEESVILDTHAAIKTPFGYIPGLPKWSIEALNPDSIVMISATGREIARRRDEDDERERNEESPESLKEYQNIAKQMASSDAVLTGCYFKVIENERKKAEQAAEELSVVLDN